MASIRIHTAERWRKLSIRSWIPLWRLGRCTNEQTRRRVDRDSLTAIEHAIPDPVSYVESGRKSPQISGRLVAANPSKVIFMSEAHRVPPDSSKLASTSLSLSLCVVTQIGHIQASL